jgi:hypothetical protein
VPVAITLLALVLLLVVWRTLATRRAVFATRPRYRFVPPDDDPDFIRELHRRTRQADDEQSHD